MSIIGAQENLIDLSLKEKGYLLGSKAMSFLKERGKGSNVKWGKLRSILGYERG